MHSNRSRSRPAAQPRAADVTLLESQGLGPQSAGRALPRRTVLRGLGVALALPWLEAHTSPRSAATPTRLWYVYAPNGVDVENWRVPPGPLPAELPPSLRSLEPWRAEVLALRGLTQHSARANGDGPGDHARAAAAWLTGVQPLKSEGQVRLGVSADQVAAEHIGAATRFRSLVVGTQEGRTSGQCDSGYSCAYSNNISWASATTPVPKVVDPLRAFDRLFRGGDDGLSPAERRARLARRESVLDFVRADARALERRLGAEDRQRLDAYEQGLRELERRLAAAARAAEDDYVEAVPDEARPSHGPATFAEHAAFLGDVITLGFQADVARVATMMLGNEGSARRYTEIGVTEGHHPLSHHGRDVEKLAAIQRIDALHVAAVAHAVARLAAVEEAGARLLDHTALVYGACIADGNRHDHHDLPTLLIGGRRVLGAGDPARGGRCLEFPKDTPLNDLHLALLARLGVENVALGDGRGPLDWNG